MPQRELGDFADAWMIGNRRERPKEELVIIRRLEAADRAAWGRLRCALWSGHDRTKLEKEIDDVLHDSERQAVFVSQTLSGTLCGMIEASLRLHAEGCRTSPVGYIEGWYVDSGWRGRGIGRRLAHAAEAWALSVGCSETASDTTDDYPDSPAVHRALGYAVVESKLRFRKELPS
jgi:aminoglycoside 6'-N-acetyltransferase I